MDGNWTAAAGLHHFIGNRWIAAATGQSIDVIDPSDGQPFARIARGAAADIDAAVRAARRSVGDAFEGVWGRMSATERGRILMKLSAAVLVHHDELARLESRTTGKPLKQGRADATALARYFEYYAGAADKLHGETIPYQAGMTVLTIREPHGVTGHIIPWNYPMQIFGRSVGAALAAGNACVVKPAEDACLSLLRVAELGAEAGLPDGALNIVTGYGGEAGAALAAHSGIDHISFTGSPVTGTAVAQAAAKHHCPMTLELGGKSPQIVFADADLDDLLPVVVNAIVQNCGQTCSAGSRLLVERPLYEELVARVGDAVARLRVGPALADLDESHLQPSFLDDDHGTGRQIAEPLESPGQDHASQAEEVTEREGTIHGADEIPHDGLRHSDGHAALGHDPQAQQPLPQSLPVEQPLTEGAVSPGQQEIADERGAHSGGCPARECHGQDENGRDQHDEEAEIHEICA